MRKLMLTAAFVALFTIGVGVAPAEARDRGCNGRGRNAGYYGGGYGGGYGGSAWNVVQSDPCLADAYARYARKHENPNKRARKIEKLAREGCPNPDRYYGARYEGPHGGPYGGAPYGGGYDYEPRYDRRQVYNPYYGNQNPYGQNPYGGGPYYAPSTGNTALDLAIPLMGLFLGR
jgi:hypothetical protein